LPCVGDCDSDRRVFINELQQSASIFLLLLDQSACPHADPDASGTVEITELQQAAITFLFGCP
jgi:hypothetical protein